MWKKAVPTLVFYIIAFVVIAISFELFPGDRCNPGFAILSVIALPIISVLLIVKNLYQPFHQETRNILAAIIHLLFLVIFILFMLFN